MVYNKNINDRLLLENEVLLMKALIKAALLAGLSISILGSVQAEEFMALDDGKGITLTNELGIVVAPAQKDQRIAYVGVESSPAYGSYKQGQNEVITNLKTKQQIAKDVNAVIYSDFDYLAIKKVGNKGYKLYSTDGQILHNQSFDSVDPISQNLLLGESNGTWQLYSMPTLALIDPTINTWIPMDQAHVIIGLKNPEGQGTKTSYNPLADNSTEKVYYNYGGTPISRDQAIAAAKEAEVKKQSDSPIPVSPKLKSDAIPMPERLNNGAHIKEVIAPFSDGIAFVKADNKKQYAINPKGEVLFSVDEYDSIDPYDQGLAYVGRKTKSMNLGGILNTVLVGISLGHGYDDDYYSFHQHRHYSSYVGPNYDYNGIWIDTGASYSWTKSKLKHGYIDHKGIEIISSKNDAVGPISDHGIMVYNKGSFGVYNKKGQAIIPMNYSDMQYLPQHKAYIVQARDTKKYGVVSENNEVLLPLNYEKIAVVSKAQLKAKVDKQWHLVTPASMYKLSAYGYDAIDPIATSTINSTLIPATKDKDLLMIDARTGAERFSLPEKSKEVKDITKEHIVFKGKKGYGVVNYDGKVVVEPIYKHITIVEQPKSK